MHRLLIVPIVIALTACGGGSKNESDATDTPTEGVPDVDGDLVAEPTDDPAPPDGEEDVMPDAEEDATPDAEEDATPDAEEDAAVDAEEDAAVDADDDALSECAEILECLQSCMPTDTACLGRCMSGASTTTRTLLRAIISCAETTISGGRCSVCTTGTDTGACWTCLETACSSEVAACIGS